MKGKKWTLVLGLGLLGVAAVVLAADSVGGSKGGPGYPKRDLTGLQLWDVVRVVGPDRMILRQGAKQHTVRLLGVSNPQVKSGDKNGAGYQARALEFLSNLLAGERVFVLWGQVRRADRKELTAVKLFREPDGLYVNLEAVRQGYLRMGRDDLGTEQGLFEAYQQRAKLAGKGLWGLPSQVKPAVEGQGKSRVYVTKAGKKYHRGSCRFLARSKIAMSMAGAKSRGYTACKICGPSR